MAVYFDRKDDYGYIRWALEVKQRDHFTCFVCGRRGVELNSHHLNSWSDHPSQRYDVSNGVTLCRVCHDSFHDIYKKGGNTVEQFNEFQKIMSVLIGDSKQKALMSFSTRKMLQKAEKDLAIKSILEDLEKDGYGKANE